MYQNIYYDRFNKEVHLWDDEMGYHVLPYTKYAYIEDKDGTYETMDGVKVRKTLEWSKDAVALGKVYENSVRPEMRVLIDLYSDSDEPSKNHCVMCLDIEVAKEGKYSTAEEANNTITSIAYHDSISNEYVCLILDREQRLQDSVISDAKVFTFSTEYELLMSFIERWNKLPITIVTGWNVLYFDLLYLYNRIEKIVGRYQGKWLSPIQKVDNYINRRGDHVFRIAGISVLDYMMIYKEFTYKEQSSYKLDTIAKVELGRGKIEYDKNLDHLLATDPVKFIEYNVEDVRIVLDLDKKLDFIAIAMGTCHKGHVPYEDVFFTSRYMEGACLTETKKRGIVATRSNINHGEKAQGAFVKRSKPGRYSWVYDLDLTALYPTNIMSLNISPETQWGKITNWDSNEFISNIEKEYTIDVFDNNHALKYDPGRITNENIREFLVKNNFSIAANGMIYTLDKVGLIPSLLETWFAERADYRKTATKCDESGDEEMYNFYDRKQKIQKVLLNSLYGVLLLPIFRFYDKDNGEAVTLTGQQLIHYTTNMANYVYNQELGTDMVDYCLYTDTDSIFYEAMPIINHRYGDVFEEEIPELTIKVATDVQNFINKSYDVYADRFHCLKEHKWNIKQELVARRAFWGAAKKRYAMWIVRDGSKVVDKPDIKGFDSVRSDFPKLFKQLIEDVIIDILHDADPIELNERLIKFKEGLRDYPIFDIMNPTSVKDLEKWKPELKVLPENKELTDYEREILISREPFKKHTPIHVKSAMNYNKFLLDSKITEVPKIVSGDKILWAYLKDNPLDFNSMALVGYDDPDETIEYMNKYINRDKAFDKAMEKKLQAMWDDLGWGSIILNKNISKFFEF